MTFKSNKYANWYFSIIDKRKTEKHPPTTYTERHHIIPKSLGGTNDSENLIRLSAREHFLVHWLLTKMCLNRTHEIKMRYALIRLMAASNSIETHVWSKWQYETAKSNKIAALAEDRRNGKDPRLGKKHSEESKEKMRLAKLGKKRAPEVVEAMKGRKHTEERRRKISEGLTGRSFSEESRKKSSLSQKGAAQNKTRMNCTVCGAENYATQIKRYHNDNCKQKSLG